MDAHMVSVTMRPRVIPKRLSARPGTPAAVLALATALLAGCAGPATQPRTDPEPAPETTQEQSLRPIPDVGHLVPKPEPDEADKVVVVKSLRQLRLLADGEVFRTYEVSLGREPKGDKLWEGDGRTPEGHYTLDFKNENSDFYRSIRVSYPNQQDWREARAIGVHPGSNIMIHGLKPEFADIGKGHLRQDWTEGCIAVTNRQIDEIWSLVPVGTPIEIRP
ncbi:L,D-transpeptidase family protein [Rhodovibrio sodomensis]|nr:L,D-transpeptidase family protein [Rhodovibrio sodomensis]